MTYTFNGKTWEEVRKELWAPFSQDQLKKNYSKEIYVDAQTIKKRLSDVLGCNYSISNLKVNFSGTLGESYDPKEKKVKPLYHVCVQISIVVFDDTNTISRTFDGVGAISKINVGLDNKISFDSMLSGAKTRAIRNASRELGIGLYLYDDEYLVEDEPSSKTEESKSTDLPANITSPNDEVREVLKQLGEEFSLSKDQIITGILKYMGTQGFNTSELGSLEPIGKINKAMEFLNADVDNLNGFVTFVKKSFEEKQ